MNSNEHYLDYNATAPLLPEVWEAMQTIQATSYGNPSSPHGPGRRARNRLEEARRQLASLLGVEYQELCFTSGGSESNNAILRQFLRADKPNHWILSPLEHPSLLETAQYLAEQGQATLDLLPVDRGGRVLPEALPELIRPETCLISVMGANNETGVIQPIAELQAIASEHGIPLHTDSVQLLGRAPLSWKELGVSYATATAHKLGGPRGIGLLYVREGAAFTPLITGGKQERVRRAGTESVALAVGFASALAWVLEQQPQLAERLQNFQQQVLERLQTVEGFFLNGDPEKLLPNTLNVGFQGLSAETLLISLDLDGVAVSTGSACSSGALEPSPVLLAMGLTPTEARSCLRL
ncbi:MAG: cysteine desulfurase family protein, partial [bacterium]